MIPARRTALAIAVGALLAFTAAAPVSAALLWSLVASPLAVAIGTPTTFNLTAANLLLGRIRCVVVDVPTNFVVAGVGAVDGPGSSWVGTRHGNRVTVRATSGGDELGLLESVDFAITATAMSGGSLAWNARSYDDQDCDGGGTLIGVPPIVVVTGPAVTPTPAPTPPPTPAPTASPTPAPTPRPPSPTPTPILPLPSSGPSRTPGPTGAPDDATSTPSPTPGLAGSRSPAPSGDEPVEGSPGRSASPDPVALAPGSAGGGGPPGGTLVEGRPAEPRLVFDARDLDLGFGAVGLIGGIEIWAVPAATIGVPGLLVLLWAALQAIGALAWVPAARRLRGEDRSVRQRRP